MSFMSHLNRFQSHVAMLALLLLLGWMLPANLHAEEEFDSDKDKTEESEGPPKVVKFKRTSRDGLQLHGDYYAGMRGENSVPVVILHDIGESRDDYVPLALYLQSKGHAVVLPDMRGHGDSTKFKGRNGKTGRTIGSKDINQKQVLAMSAYDMAAIRSFLVKKHEKKQLNIGRLCLIGTGVGSWVAMNYTVIDWNWEDLAFKRQGKEVQALVLISPVFTYKGLKVNDLLKKRVFRQGHLSLLLMVGRDDKRAFKQVGNIHKKLARDYPEPKESKVATDKKLFFVKRATALQGQQLINTEDFKCDKAIAGFIKARIVNQAIDEE